MALRRVASKRVLFASHKLNLSGVGRHMMTLARGLQERRWEVGVVARDLDPGTPLGHESFEAAGVRIFQAPFPLYGLTAANVKAAAGTLAALGQIVDRFRPDLLHVHAPTLSPWAGIIAWRHGIPMVSTLHLETLGPNKARLARTGTRFLPMAFGSYTIAISSDMARLLVDALGLPARRVRTVLHGVDDERFRPPTSSERAEARGAFALSAADRVVCTIAVLEERKGHALLIAALSMLRRRGIDVIALCAGAGSDADRARIAAQARQAGVADLVRLLGHCDSRQVMWASDASLLLSSSEGFGLVIVESMLCGLVPLRTPSAGASDQIIDGRNGFIVPFDDKDLLTERLQTLFADLQLSRRIGQAAQDFARSRFTRAVMARQTEQVYCDAINQHRPRILPFA